MKASDYFNKDQSIRVDQSGHYKIRVRGRLSESAERRFTDMNLSVEFEKNGEAFTNLNGTIEDQAALYGVLNQIRDLGLPLILVALVYPISQGEEDE